MPENTEKATEQWERYLYVRDNGHIDYVNKADKCDDYFAGEQWDPIIKRQRDSQRLPALTINKTLATMAVVMGEQLNNRADVSFVPSVNGAQETADALTKTFINISNNNNLDWLESEVADDGFITGRGYYDVRPTFNDQIQGEVLITRPNPRNILLDPDADSYDPDSWKEVWQSKWLSSNDIAVMYSESDAEALRQRTSSTFTMHGGDSIDRFHRSFGGLDSFNNNRVDSTREGGRRFIRVLERQYKKLRKAFHFVDLNTGDTRVIPDSWSKKRVDRVANELGLGVFKKLIEQIRWVITADTFVLFDEWSPLKHFTIVPYFPYLRNGRTIGLVENFLDPQDLLNKAISQELQIINTTSNSGWKVKTGALQNMTVEDLEQRGAETGIVAELNDVGDLEKIQPNQIPSGIDRMVSKADEFIKEVSGVSDSQRGFDRADVAAKAIRAKQAAGAVNLSKPMDNLNRTRHMVATRVLDIIQAYYTEERILKVTGTDLRHNNEEIVINQVQASGQVVNDLTIGEYTTVVTTVPARDTFEQSQFQEARELRELGIAIPDHVLIDSSTLSNKAEIVKEIRDTQGAEPSEVEQHLQQLELQGKQLELQEQQAKAQLDAANAQLAAAKAQGLLDSVGGDGAGKLALDAERLKLDREKMVADIRLEREKLAVSIQLKQQDIEGGRQDRVLDKLLTSSAERKPEPAKNTT